MLEAMVADGRLGQKSGRGFYEYPEPAYQAHPRPDDPMISKEAADALTTALVEAAQGLVANGVASADDVNMAWTTATGLAPVRSSITGEGPVLQVSCFDSSSFLVNEPNEMTWTQIPSPCQPAAD